MTSELKLQLLFSNGRYDCHVSFGNQTEETNVKRRSSHKYYDCFKLIYTFTAHVLYTPHTWINVTNQPGINYQYGHFDI